MIEDRRVAIVTGGGRGIGRAIAARLAGEGVNLAISFRSNDAAAEETAERVREAGAKCELFKGDVASPGDVEALFKRTNSTRYCRRTSRARTCVRGPLSGRWSGLGGAGS